LPSLPGSSTNPEPLDHEIGIGLGMFQPCVRVGREGHTGKDALDFITCTARESTPHEEAGADRTPICSVDAVDMCRAGRGHPEITGARTNGPPCTQQMRRQ
jgi:hypothetical protein